MDMILILIFVIGVIAIVNNRRKKEVDSYTRVAMAALESGDDEMARKYLNTIDSKYSIKEKMLRKTRSGIIWCGIGLVCLIIVILQALKGTLETHFLILPAGIFITIGTANIVYGITGRKAYAKEIEAEEERRLTELGK